MAYGYKEILAKWHRIHDSTLDELEAQVCPKRGKPKYSGSKAKSSIILEAMHHIWEIEDRMAEKSGGNKPPEIHVYFKPVAPTEPAEKEQNNAE